MKTYRMFESACKVNENIDNKIAPNVSRSPCNTTIISTIGEIRNLFDVKNHLSHNQRLQYPQKLKPKIEIKSIIPPKNLSLLPRWQAPSSWDETTSKHVWPDQRLRLEWRKASGSPSISAEIGALRILSLRPYITIETAIRTAIEMLPLSPRLLLRLLSA